MIDRLSSTVRRQTLPAATAALALVVGMAPPASAVSIVPSNGVTAQGLARRQVAAVPRGIYAVRDLGRLNPQAFVSATVTLRYNRQDELDALVRAQSDPRSPQFRHFLTSDQFNAYFAPTPQQQAFVIATLQAAGLRVTQAFPNRTLLDVVGTSSAAEVFFGTQIHSVVQGKYGARFANAVPASVPASVSTLITSVSLSNLIIAKTGPRVTSPAAMTTAASMAQIASEVRASNASTEALPEAAAPAVCKASKIAGPLHNAYGALATGVADAFDYPVQHGCNGAGETVAVEISSPVSTTDIKAYLKAAGVIESGSITEIPVDGGGTYGGASSEDTDEASLDVETIAGLAPGAKIRVYNFPDLSDQHIEDGYNKAVSDNLASVTNSSFGGCETSDPSFRATTNTIAEQAASKGITFVASSGDSGSDECATGNRPAAPADPAGEPYFVSVGGDNFTESSSGKLTSLTAKGDVAGTGFLSGGGVSTVYALPSFQSGIANVVTSGRNSPDVSLPGVGVAVYVGGEVGEFDGTSWSSPCFAALLAEASEIHNARFGFVNPKIYSTFKSAKYTDFTDVTVGNNGKYSATSGYDRVTGIGAPKGFAFAQAL